METISYLPVKGDAVTDAEADAEMDGQSALVEDPPQLTAAIAQPASALQPSLTRDSLLHDHERENWQSGPAVKSRARVLLAAPGVVQVGLDLARRGDRLIALDRSHALGWLFAALVSVGGWAALLYAATARRRAIALGAALVFTLGFALSVAVEGAFFERYNVYLALEAQLDAESPWRALVGSLPLDGWLALRVTAAALFGGGLVVAARKRLGTHEHAPHWAAAPAVIPWFLFFGLPTSYRSVQSTTPDILYFDSVGAAWTSLYHEASGDVPRRARVGLRHPRPLTDLVARPARERNVVLIVEEAIRADVACEDPNRPCDGATRWSHALTPRRLQFTHMRSVASSTAISIATLWSGLPPSAPRADLSSAPLLWDYAARAGYATGYLTSQHLMFANSRLFVQDLPLDVSVSATQLDPLADVLIGASDQALSDRAIAALANLREPFFMVVHYSNAHRPRGIDRFDLPFQPTDLEYRVSPDLLQDNYYKNSVALSDKAVASFVSRLRESPAGGRTVVFYISDHGESRFEHGQNNDHGQTLFDEELRVPAWIDAPADTLSPDEVGALRSYRDTDLFQTDVTPTILDLLGVWDDTQARVRMPGLPLTRKGRAARVEALTNVSWAWEYGDPNWGVMRGAYKLFATSEDPAYRCYDVERDPGEFEDLGESACGDLKDIANGVFGGLPRELGYLKRHPAWGGYPP
ncbi:MAG: sulfatase-like hydrolase/transferase [Polyangiaceae bacterium]